MNIVSKIIFDQIISGKGINLPGIGSLYIEREGAEFVSKNKIKPPYNRVLFSAQPNQNFDSAEDIIIALEGVKPAKAAAVYKEWLDNVRDENGIVEIQDVGVLKEGVFYPSVELDAMLNPSETGIITVKKKRNLWSIALIIILIAVFVAAVAYFICPDRNNIREEARDVAVTQETAVRDTETLPDGDNAAVGERELSGADIIQRHLEELGRESEDGSDMSVAQVRENKEAASDNVDAPVASEVKPEPKKSLWCRIRSFFCKKSDSKTVAATADETRITVAEEPVAQPEDNAAAEIIEAPQMPVYHVVAGVFADPSNAEKYIREDMLMIGRDAYEKIPYRGMTMVVAFSSTDKAAALRKNRQLRDFDRGIWIYEER